MLEKIHSHHLTGSIIIDAWFVQLILGSIIYYNDLSIIMIDYLYTPLNTT